MIEDGQVYKLKLRKRQTGSPRYDINVPTDVGKMIPDGARFAFALTKTGFTYTLVAVEAGGRRRRLPDWLVATGDGR